jgi:hypothetical protein
MGYSDGSSGTGRVGGRSYDDLVTQRVAAQQNPINWTSDPPPLALTLSLRRPLWYRLRD